MTAAAIQAEYADYKRVKTRKVLQLICEVPIEQAPEIHKMLGEPAFGERQITVAIARLNVAAVAPEPPKAKNYAQQAAMCCQEQAFIQFLRETVDIGPYGHDWGEGEAASTVRALCQVSSRSQLIEGSEAGERWRKLWLDYQNWLKQ